ncbi:MAG TPA: site-specific integrase [Hyphomicrobiaceae bacterium]|jgi:integrase
MPTIRYNDKAVGSARCRRDAKGNAIRTEIRIAGGGCPVGFVLDLLRPTQAEIQAAKAKGVEPPEGAAVFRLVYSVPRPGGKRTLRKLRIGTRGVMPLHEARERALAVRLRVERGEDPAAERKTERAAVTFKELAERRLKEDGNIGDSTRDYHTWLLNKYAFPAFGGHAADKVSPHDVIKLTDQLAKRDALVTADRVKAAVSAVYSWAMQRRDVQSNPCSGLGRRSASEPREHTLSDADIRATWEAIEASDLSEPMRIILKLLLYTGQRAGEVGGARVVELASLDDEAAAGWTIPGKVMRKGKVVAINGRTTKAGREHRVPLPRQAVALFRRALDLAGDAEFVFPAHAERRPADRPPAQGHIDRHSISRAMARLRDKFEIDQEGTCHDMRRTCATWLGDQGIRPDVIERILNHAPQGVTRKHYDHSRLEPMVREALQQWADHVDTVVRGKGRRRQPEATASDEASSVSRLMPRYRVRKATPQRLRAASQCGLLTA